MQKPDKIISNKLIGTKLQFINQSITDKDAIIYAMGIGFNIDPLRQQDFKFTFQFLQNFTPFPTMGAIIPKFNMIQFFYSNPYVPQFNPYTSLHAQHMLTMVKPKLQIGVIYHHQGVIADCISKGKNAFVLFQANSYTINQKGQKQLAFINQTLMFLKGLGGFKSQGKGLIKPLLDIPSKQPDFKFLGLTYPNQAFVYKLSGDTNPLHIDPQTAKTQKFDRPILHGLATYGVVARVIVQNLLNNDQTQLKTYRTRFTGHVYPGQNLDIHIWKYNETIYIYQVLVQIRKTRALIGHFQIRPAAKL